MARETAQARAEPVGSLLRPPQIKETFARVFAGHASHSVQVLDEDERAQLSELEAVADEAIRSAIGRQIDAGLDVVTDGELRRAHFVNSLFDAVEGVTENERFDSFEGEGEVGPPPDPIATERLRLVDNPLVHEATFLTRWTDHPWKVTVPAISNFYMVQYLGGAYASPDEFVAHMGELTAALVAGAVAAGTRYIQFDFPLYPALCDPEKRAELESGLGESAASILDKAIAADRAMLEAVPAGVTTGMHICRGNFRSRFWATGSLEPVAERMFGELGYDRFLVEWEDVEREGGFEALRNVPTPGPVVVLGIVSTKRAELESDDAMIRRIEDAASFLDLDQLAISPQCGFASVWHGNEITEDVQWGKLELVGRVAERVWGAAP